MTVAGTPDTPDNVVLLPNIMAINAHLYALFPPAFVKDYPDAWIEIAYGHPSGGMGGAINAAETFSAFDLKGASDFAVAKNAAGYNVYVGPALRQGAPGRGGRATDANYLASRYAWVDVDEGYDATIDLLRVFGLRPAMIIRTGSIPEPRLQIYFQLAEAVSSLQLRTLNAALHVFLPVSDSVGSPTHVMRLNGTVNYPTAGKTTRGRVAEVVGFDLATEDIWRHAGSYTERQLLEEAGVSTVPEASPAPTGDPYERVAREQGVRQGRTDDELLRLLESTRTAGNWHEPIRSAIATMVGRGYDERMIRLVCAPYLDKGIDDDCRDLVDLIDGAFAKFGKGAPPEEEETPQTPQAPPGQASPGDTAAPKAATPDLYERHWHNAKAEIVLRKWLIHKFLPEVGTGLFSGQWGTGKSYAVLDLAACIMTGTPFAGHPIARRGGVLFIAAEAASEMIPRLHALVEHKLRPAATPAILELVGGLDEMPFAWIEDAPNMQNAKDCKKLIATARATADDILAKYDIPLALIIIDTMSAVGHYKSADDTAEAQRVMNAVVELSRRTGAFVLVVDHFGKAIETGTRGSSAKEGSADAVIALTADRDIGGTLTNTKMSLRKSRGSRTGAEVPFDLIEVDIGFGETACIVGWKEVRSAEQGAPKKDGKKRWPKGLYPFRVAMHNALAEHGKHVQPFGTEGPTVLAVEGTFVRVEFLKSYPAAGDNPAAAKRAAYSRALRDIHAATTLVQSREIGEHDYFWFVEADER